MERHPPHQDDLRREPHALPQLYERMLLIRRSEEQLAVMFRNGQIPGFIHLSIGQEATAVGVAAALDRDDTLASTHRGHGHALAKGMELSKLFLEIAGKAEGVCQGRGGSLHVADFSVGMLGANGIVAGGIPIALGSAFAHKRLRSARVAVACFGDGALAEGVLYESVNLAAIWSLPLLLVCENNGWSEFSPGSSQYRGSLDRLAATFGLPFRVVDGNDVEAVAAAARALVDVLRSGGGPAILECRTSRVGGHYEGDPQTYRAASSEVPVADPLAVTLDRLRAQGVTDAELAAVDGRVALAIERATHAVGEGTEPVFAAALDDVYAGRLPE